MRISIQAYFAPAVALNGNLVSGDFLSGAYK